MATVWKVMTGIAGGGLLSVFLLKEIAMHTATDNRFGLQGQQKGSTTSSEADEAAGEKPANA